MLIIPAIDIKDGKCVRLMKGNFEDETIYSDSPLEMAKRWAKEGAELIHIVDLDGAREGRAKNEDKIKHIAHTVNIPIQLGGGIRDLETMERYLSLGISRVILGTATLLDENLVIEASKRFPGKVVAGIDAKDGFVAIKGWVEVTNTRTTSLAKHLEDKGISAIIFTDIDKDGTRSGVNIKATQEILDAVSIPVIASGGISTLKDVEKLLPLEKCGLAGIITGRALYAGSLDLKEAIALTKRI
ncbi:MAG: 1-(5-phosphoribosyl)-5-[(5-phosphoribosylamino)methylideneamino]imidazole-4-carboxamide isomerase [Thermodesulfobacteriota bacterium]|nr:1-(5-phosphoribosyl)-5-[(5-phosphoribosylamino)methylideneamino]imidazole-4-carboxamide isomerase [Thermodesulfobacteriota bacterium]